MRAITKIGGGADGTQTHDLYDANVALYQLSYNPKTFFLGFLETLGRLRQISL